MKKILITFLAVSITGLSYSQQPKDGSPAAQPPVENSELFKLGMAGYSFRFFDIDTALDAMDKLDMHYLCVKDFHLPIKSDYVAMEAFKEKLKAKNITPYAVGPINMNKQEQIADAFNYAKLLGVDMIVGVPAPELLPLIEQKVRETNIKYAIHMHGPDASRYPDADDVWSHIKGLDPRIGMCLDIGHDLRAGKDPVADMKKYQDRIFDIHLKDVTAATALGASVEMGRGKIDFPSFVKMLRQTGYNGVCSLEHEKDMKDPMSGIAESIGFFRGVIVGTKK